MKHINQHTKQCHRGIVLVSTSMLIAAVAWGGCASCHSESEKRHSSRIGTAIYPNRSAVHEGVLHRVSWQGQTASTVESHCLYQYGFRSEGLSALVPCRGINSTPSRCRPPDYGRQPVAKQSEAVIGWIHDVRKYEAQRNAGDPGPVLARRLSNAEYDYSIRDLTGVDMRPTREFPR